MGVVVIEGVVTTFACCCEAVGVARTKLILGFLAFGGSGGFTAALTVRRVICVEPI